VPTSPHTDTTKPVKDGNSNSIHTSQGGERNDSKIFKTALHKLLHNCKKRGKPLSWKRQLAETTQKGFKNLDNVLQEGLFNKSFTNQTGTSSGNINTVSQQGVTCQM
jgi:hypothetical protein